MQINSSSSVQCSHPLLHHLLTLPRLVTVDALLSDHPGEQVDLGDNSSRASLTVYLLSDDGGRIPLEELVQIAQLGIPCDLDELPPAADLGALTIHLQSAEVLNNLVELAEIEHDILNL